MDNSNTMVLSNVVGGKDPIADVVETVKECLHSLRTSVHCILREEWHQFLE